MITIQSLLNEFNAIDAYLKAVREILQEGHMPDMAGLDKRVAALCSTLETADTDVQQQCVPKLSDLIKRLDVCETEIRSFHAAQNKGHS